jgi:hypothetical protein
MIPPWEQIYLNWCCVMAKISIFNKGLHASEINALKDLLKQTKLCDGPIDLVQTIVAPTVGDAVVIILGSTALCSDPDLDGNLAPAAGSPQRAIWVWPQGSTAVVPPAAAKKFCFSIVPWNAQKLAEVVGGDDVVCFEGPTGKLLPKVEMDRNLCVDEEVVEEKVKSK